MRHARTQRYNRHSNNIHKYLILLNIFLRSFNACGIDNFFPLGDFHAQHVVKFFRRGRLRGDTGEFEFGFGIRVGYRLFVQRIDA